MGGREHGRGGLDDAPFSFREGGTGNVLISWRGRQVAVLRGARAQAFLRRVAGLDDAGRQIVMAKATGNFKRGNER